MLQRQHGILNVRCVLQSSSTCLDSGLCLDPGLAGMLLQLPEYCPLEQLSKSKHAPYLDDNDFSWQIVYANIQQILVEHISRAALSDFQSLLGTEWLADSVIAALIDCMKRGIPKPDSTAAITMEPPSALRGIAAGKHARCIDWDEVCILDPAMSRKILMAFQTGDYGDVLRVFSKQCKFKTVRRILLPLNISWQGITLGTGCHWMLAELHLDTGTTHCTTGSRRHTTSTKTWQV